MKRTLDIVAAQIAAYAELQREIEMLTGRIFSGRSVYPYASGTDIDRLETYVADRLSDLRFEQRQIRSRANVHA